MVRGKSPAQAESGRSRKAARDRSDKGVAHTRASNLSSREATSKVLKELIELSESISGLEKELALKLARFDELKRKV